MHRLLGVLLLVGGITLAFYGFNGAHNLSVAPLVIFSGSVYDAYGYPDANGGPSVLIASCVSFVEGQQLISQYPAGGLVPDSKCGPLVASTTSSASTTTTSTMTTTAPTYSTQVTTITTTTQQTLTQSVTSTIQTTVVGPSQTVTTTQSLTGVCSGTCGQAVSTFSWSVIGGAGFAVGGLILIAVPRRSGRA